MFKCPQCGKRHQYKLAVMYHIFDEHFDWMDGTLCSLKGCWCGEGLWDSDQFAKHLKQQKTTPRAHYLAHLLGVD